MLSRVADSLYWMSRYIERAGNTARLLNVHVQLNLEMSSNEHVSNQQPWEPVISTLDDRERFEKIHKQADEVSVVDYVMFEPENPNSVLSSISRARENARTIREQISVEMWEHINRMYLALCDPRARRRFRASSFQQIQEIIEGSQSFQGVADSTMSQGEGWQFIRLGRFTGRADSTSRILDLKYHMLLPHGEFVGGNVDTIQWMALLRSCSALDAFLKVHAGLVSPWSVADFLIMDELFPRSIRFCIGQVDDALHKISGSPPGHFTNEPERLSGRLQSMLAYTTTSDIISAGLHEFLDQVQIRLIELTNAVFKQYCDWNAR